ncbi:MAG TPA: hypothetical protein VEA36_00390 [Candidatus Paceibacterota bacterium]|nr:hypothetical protein [Candidatus Paceibacterota bacterium]
MKHLHRLFRNPVAILVGFGLVFIAVTVHGIPYAIAMHQNYAKTATTSVVAKLIPPAKPTLDTKLYDTQLERMANYASTTATSSRLWPVKTSYPKAGAILPMKRVVAYYGNFYSTRMGILGEFDEATVLARLKGEVAKWEAADPETKVVPAIDYIATTAQLHPQADKTYRLRMPDEHIQRAITMARKVNGITVLEIQAGLAPLQSEITAFEKYLVQPDVHLAIDPEFNMKGGEAPGTVIGTVSASDINRASAYLAELVRKHDLPPKILVVHRFTQRMVTDYQLIETRPEVQIVMVMDGWGPPAKKINTYKSFIYPEPVEFTGFKIFYKNDMKPPSERLLTPADLLKLTPRPMYIQYQ